MLGGLPGAPPLHRLKSKPPALRKYVLRVRDCGDLRASGGGALRASGCGLANALRRRGTAATEPKLLAMACSAPLALPCPAACTAPLAVRCPAPRLAQRYSLCPCL